MRLPSVVRKTSTTRSSSLLRAAHEVCPYSNATRGNIVVDIQLA